MHFADTADLEQGITVEGQPGFPTPPRGCFQKIQDPAKSGKGAAALYLDGGFQLTAPAKLVDWALFFTLHLDTCQLC